jgi:flagellin
MSRINTNVESLIARRTLDVNNTSLNRTLGRLSTGLRINSGRDDPAGLIASETLRSDMRAINTAVQNATRADTVVSVAEGGLQEISSLLLDLENLIDQTANQAALTPEEVSANQLQIDSILASINRLAEATAFGSKKLLNGSMAFTTSGVNIDGGSSVNHLDRVQINAAKVPAGSFRQVNVNVVTPSTNALISAVGAGVGGTLDGAATIQIRGNLGTETLSFASSTAAADIATAINASKALTGVSATVSAGGGTPALVLQSTGFGSDQFVSVAFVSGTSAFVSQAETDTQYGSDGTVLINGSNAVVRGLNASLNNSSLSVDLSLNSSFGGTAGSTTTFDITGGGAVFSISPTVGLSGLEAIGVDEVSTSRLGNAGVGFLSTLGTGLANDLASGNFATAQRVVRSAINQVATLRGRLGGFQKDTLATTINSLKVASENITAAESAIRDADFAIETSNLTRAQILLAASTSVLQLANAQPQNALSLLG